MIENYTLRQAREFLEQRWLDLDGRCDLTEYDEEEKLCTEWALERLELVLEELGRLLLK